MNETRARKILESMIIDQDSTTHVKNELDGIAPLILWRPHNETVRLIGRYTVDHLSAIEWWMRNKGR